MADHGPERGDFAVLTGSDDHPPAPPPGYRRVGGAEWTRLFVRPGFGISVAERPFGAVVVCGSTVEPPDLIAEAAAQALLRAGARHVDPHRLTTHFRDVVGHFAIAIASGGDVWTVTDHLGTIPVFLDGAGTSSTSLWALARDNRDLDADSVREFVASGRITAPYTILESVERQAPATAVSASGSVDGPYWRPPAPDLDADAGAPQLRNDLIDVLTTLAKRTSACTLMYSGGEDARILGALAHRAGLDVHGVIFLDRPNREHRHASLAARLCGVDLETRTRGATHDADGLSVRVARNDPGFDLLHAHADRLIRDDDPRPVLDGWFAALYKGDDVSQRRRSWRGIPLGPARVAATPASRTSGAIERSARKAATLSHLPAAAQAEWLEYYPASDAATYGFFAFNQRSFPGFSPLVLHPLVELTGRVPADQRLDRGLYKRAFGRSIGSAAVVPRSDGEILAFGPRLDLAATAINKTVYKLSDRISGRSNGPWQTNAVRRAAADLATEMCDTAVHAELIELAGIPSGWAAQHRLAQLALALHYVRDGAD